MKVGLIISTLFFAVNCATDRELWAQFKADYGKTYKSYLEDQRRFSIFQSNLRIIEEHNQKYNNSEVTYYLKITKFADLSEEEFENMYLNYKKSGIFSNASGDIGVDIQDVPYTIDWRKAGVVTGVKDQGDCGSCWAFSVTGALEAQNAILHKVLVSLSEQQLLDCDRNEEQCGCDGGNMDTAFHDLTGKPLYTEQSYPYEEEEGECRTGIDSYVRVKSFDVIPKGEENLRKAVGIRGPLSIGVNGGGFAMYGGGIFNNPKCKNEIDHAVLVVGYGVVDDHEYWIIKNSWGKDWGEKGYIFVARNKNLCAIGQENIIPVVV